MGEQPMNTITKDTTKEELLEEYRSYPATGGEKLLEEKPFYESRLAPLFYETPRGSKVLDVGCNDGTFMRMLKEKRDCYVYGVDIAENPLSVAKDSGLNVQYADAHHLPFDDRTFDVVILSEVISHVHNPEEVLAEIRRVLKKNGVLLGSAPHANLQKYIWEDARKIRQYYDADQLHVLLQKSFQRSWIKVLNGAEFSISMISSFLGNEPVEMLFKAGNSSVLGWDAALQDRSVLRCWMGFTQGPGVAYYRMSGFADKMQKMGAEVHYNPYTEADPNSTAEWTQKIVYLPAENRFTNQHIVRELDALLRASDLSVFQVTSSRSILLLLTTARKGAIKKPLIMELDDWIFDLPSYNLASGAYHPNSEPEAVAYDQVKLSDAFIVSTQYLKEKLEQLAPGKPIYVIKNTLDFDIWDKVVSRRPAHDANPDLIRIGYTGCQNHSGDIEVLKKPLLALFDEFPNVDFISLPHGATNDMTTSQYKRVTQWAPLSIYPQAMSDWEIDIGVAPLRDNELNRAKSNLRWLEYSALKIPTIASKVYPFEKSLTNGKDGLLVSNSATEWYEAMRSLIVDHQRRKSMGEAAYGKVRKFYSMDDEAKKYLSVLKEIKRQFVRGKSERIE
jgi:SAM-dependent methyltransferase/glycosyltransferase involved in cell wall biosynthesis